MPIQEVFLRYPNITDEMNPAIMTLNDMSIVAISFI